MVTDKTEVYSPREIARAAGVPLARVVAAIGSADILVGHAEAVRVGRALAATEWVAPRIGYRSSASETLSDARSSPAAASRVMQAPLFATLTTHSAAPRARSLSFALSSTVHAGMVGVGVFLTSLSLSPTAAVLSTEPLPDDKLRLVYLATPGPGGGGGGGGRRQPLPAPKALREGRRAISSPVPVRRPPPAVQPVVAPPEPTPPPLNAEPLPVLVAPIVSAPADDRNRIGVLEPPRTEAESHGPGQGGGAGTGTGTGLGQGDGSGVGDGSGGGTGGGPYRPGSGIEPPRLLREVKADYTEEARRRGLEGEVVLEIIVTRDGAVRDVKILRRLGSGLDERAVAAVRQWRFAPASRKGVAVDVVVEVAVEFKLR
jgi:TonB family protein